MSRPKIPEPNEKQKLFADHFIENGLTDAYQAAISAGYSKTYAHRHSYEMSENVRIKHYIVKRTGAERTQKWRRHILLNRVTENLLQIGSGSTRKSHYQMIDNKDPTNSTDQTIIGPAAIKAQVDAGKAIIQYISSPITEAQIRRLNAKSYIDENTADEIKRENADKHVHKQVPLVGFLKKIVKKQNNSKSDKSSSNKKQK